MTSENVYIHDSGRGNDNTGLGALAGILPIALLAPLLTGRGLGGERDGGGDRGVAREVELAAILRDNHENAIATLTAAKNAEIESVRQASETRVILQADFAKLALENCGNTNKVENKIEECCRETQEQFCQLKAEVARETDRILARMTFDEERRMQNRIIALETSIRDINLLSAIRGVPGTAIASSTVNTATAIA